MIGRTISHYRITGALGRGGMGMVYRAEDLKLGREVALKFLPPERACDEEARQRFEREARAAARLEHPAVCAVYESGETPEGEVFIAMALCEGETLQERLKGGPLPEAEAISLVARAADGLAYAHRQGVIHRDINPANLMVQPDGTVKILDFGVAKLTDATSLTQAGATVGTAAYMSPEQARGMAVDPRTDIWSLGTVLYELVTGQPPFGCAHPQAVIHAILYDAPAPLAALRVGLSAGLQQVIDRALAKKPAQRYRQAEELAAALRALPSPSAGAEQGQADQSFLTPGDVAVSSEDVEHLTQTALRSGPHRWPPWWVLAIGVLIAVPFLLWCWQSFLGPEDLTFGSRYVTDGFLITSVEPDGAESRAGLSTGDCITSLGGLKMTREYYGRWLDHCRVGVPYPVRFLRAGAARTAVLVLQRRSWAYWGKTKNYAIPFVGLMSAIWLALAGTLVFLRPDDRLARLGALWLACWSLIGYAWRTPPGVGAVLGDFPPVVGRMVILCIVIGIGITQEALTAFLASFPRKLFTAWWAWALLWSPALLRIWSLAPGFGEILDPPAFSFSQPQFLPVTVRTLRFLYLFGSIVIVVLNFHFLTDRNQRRRLRIFVVGITAILGGLMLLMAAAALYQATLVAPVFGLDLTALGYRLFSFINHPLVRLPLALTCSLGAVLLAVAIVRHRLLGVRLMIRQGLHYTAARGLLLALMPICAAVLTADLLLHGDRPLWEILAARGWFYLLLGGAGASFHFLRKRWLPALDRRFFRQVYDAHRILTGAIQEIRQADTPATAAAHVTGRIMAALRPEFAVLLTRAPGVPSFSILAVTGQTGLPKQLAGSGDPPRIPPLPADGKLMAIVRALRKPLEITPAGSVWLWRQLPPAEADWLGQTRVEWLFPVVVGTKGSEALLIIGPKLSQEPYLPEEQDLLTGVAAALSLRMESDGGPELLVMGGAADLG